MKKILQLINSSGQGGAETVVKEIISQTGQLVFCLKKDKTERFGEVSKNVYFGTKSNYYKYNPVILIKLIKLIKRNKINVLHAHLGNSLLYGLLAKHYIKDIKLIYHEHGEILLDSKKLPYVLEKYNKKINTIIAVSEATKQALIIKAKIDPKKIIVLYNFVDLGKFNRKYITWNIQREKEKLGIKPNEFVIGFVGRLAKIKGCEYLIKALPYLSFEYKCLIAGDGPLKKGLIRLTKKLHVEQNVLFLGYVEDIKKIYSLMDIDAMPSLSEASPLSFYEAQAFGIPIVGSDVIAINEFVTPNKNGFLFKVKDPMDLAEKINYIYRYKSLKLKIRAYSSKNIKKYSLKNFLKNLEQIYLLQE